MKLLTTERMFLTRFVLPELRRKPMEVLAGVALLLSTTALAIGSVEVSRSLLQTLRDTPPTGPTFALLNALGVETRTDRFVVTALLAVVLPTLLYIGMYGREWVFERISIAVTQTLRNRLFSHLLTVPYLQSLEFQPGVLVKRLVQDAARIRTLVIEGFLARIADVLLVLGMLCYLLLLDWRLALVVLLALVVYLGGSLWSARMSRQAIHGADKALESVASQAEETFNRLPDVRANCRENWEASRFTRTTSEEAKRNRSMVKWLLLDRSITGYLSALGPVAVAVAGGALVFSGSLSLETLIAFSVTTAMLYKPVDSLSAIPILLQKTSVALENMKALLVLPQEGEGRPNDGQLKDLRRSPADPLVVIQQLRYSYPTSTQKLMIDNIEIPAGARVAIVGPSGAGKSTLLRLLFGLLEGYEGRLELLGNEISDLPLQALRSRVAFVLQDSYLFADTIKANIAYGAHTLDSVPDDLILAAVEKAGLEPEVERMQDGLDTRVTPHGSTLSGGQKRRLMLARALVRKPDLLLLDEPLAGVAPRERGEIIRSVLDPTNKSTTLFTTHELDLVQAANMVICLSFCHDKSEIVVARAGTLEELMQNNTDFRSQFATLEPSDSDHAM